MKIKRGGGDKWLNSIFVGAIFSCVGFMVRSSIKGVVVIGFAILWLLFAVLIKIYYDFDEKLKKVNNRLKKNK